MSAFRRTSVFRRTKIALLLCAVVAPATVIAGQAPAKVDYRNDVQPILRARCYSCHGAEVHMNRLRLDRRADAMRGGSQTDIGPGNAEGSRLYHRLIGTRFGTQMPPGQPLPENEIAIIKAWIDQGAEWPDELSGETPAPPVDADADRLMTLIRDGDFAAANRTIANAPGVVRKRGAGGSTPLMYAALYGDVALVKRVLAAGADPDAANVAGARALMWAVPDVDKMRALLDRGADVNARSEEGRSALHVATGVIGSRPAVQLLLDYGADPWAPVTGDFSLLREAVRVDNPDVFRLLRDYGVGDAPSAVFTRTNCFECARLLSASAVGPLPRVPPPDTGLRPVLPDSAASRARPVGATSSTPGAIRAAVERSLPLLQRVDIPFIQKTGCVSCHHNSLVSMTVSSARQNGYRVDEHIVSEQRQIIANYLESWRERTLQNMFIAGQQDTISYLMFGMHEAAHPPDPATDAQAIWIKRRQLPDGHWPVQTIRPPIESYDIEVTALSMRTLQVYAPKTDRASYAEAVERARKWLETANAQTTEESAFRLLGLKWAEAASGVVADAVKELIALQRSDGGWAQMSSMDSDAYATGEALVALRKAGIAADHPAFRKGVDFLLRTQLQDGSWFVKSRSEPIQAYFESGFPHGADQWISAAATAWATTALAEAK